MAVLAAKTKEGVSRILTGLARPTTLTEAIRVNYLAYLRTPYFLRLLVGSFVGRLPSSMAAVAMPLALRHAGASYGFIGVVAGCFAISAAISSPLLGRAVDRIGQVSVLIPSAVATAVGFAMVAAAPHRHPVVLIGAVLAGAATPPLEPCLRVLWPDVVSDDRLEGAYAIDSAAQELIFVAGPLLVAGCVAAVSARSALWAQAALCLIGVAVFATAGPPRRWKPKPRAQDWLGPLREPGLVVLFAALAGAGFAIGTLNVLVVSYAERHSVIGGAPALLALNAFASLVGVLIYGAISWQLALNRRLICFAAGLVVGYGLLTTVPSPVYMCAIMILTGLFLAPLLATTFVLVGSLAPQGTVTEAFAWLVTLFAAGVSIGSGTVGLVLESGSLHRAAGGGVVGVLACLVVLAVGRSRLTLAPRGAQAPMTAVE